MYRIFLTKCDFVWFKCFKKGHKAENYVEIPFMDKEVEDYVNTLTLPSNQK